MNSTEENIQIAILEQLKKLNENIQIFTDIQLSHYVATGQIEMESVDNLDSWYNTATGCNNTPA